MDLTAMTDAELATLKKGVDAEVNRRANLKSACGLITDVVAQAVTVGIEQATIDAAVTAGLTPE